MAKGGQFPSAFQRIIRPMNTRRYLATLSTGLSSYGPTSSGTWSIERVLKCTDTHHGIEAC